MDALLFSGLIGGFVIALGKGIYDRITGKDDYMNYNDDDVGFIDTYNPMSPYYDDSYRYDNK